MDIKATYEHPAPRHSTHDYKHDMHKVEDHIADIIHGDYHSGKMQHLGGAASLHDHLTDLHYGPACLVKQELWRVLDYLHMYAETCHDIYCFFAEDAYKHVEAVYADMRDPEEKEHAYYFMRCVKDYMEWLKMHKTQEKANTEGMPVTNGGYVRSNSTGTMNL